MNEQFDQLHQGLADLADEVLTVDLRNRALATSRTIGIRRAVAGTTAAAVVLLASAGVAYAMLPQRHTSLPANPSPSVSTLQPSSSPSPTTIPSPPPSPTTTVTAPATPSGTVLTTDPRTTEIVNAAIDIPAWPAAPAGYCPAKIAHFRNGSAAASTGSYPTTYNLHYESGFLAAPVIYANLDGQSADEALITVSCNGENSTHLPELLAVRLMPNHTVRTLGFVIDQPNHQVLDFDEDTITVSGSTINVELMGESQSDGGPVAAKQVRGYKYGSGGFQQVSGPTTFPALPTDVHTVDLRNTTIAIGWENCGNGCTGYGPVRMVGGVGTSVWINTVKGVSRLLSTTFRIDETTNATDLQGDNIAFIRVTETGDASAPAGVYCVSMNSGRIAYASVVTSVGQDGIASILGISGGANQVQVTVETVSGQQQTYTYQESVNGPWQRTN